MSTDPGDSFSFGVGALAVVHEPRPARRSSQVLGDGALLGGCAGAVVGDHARIGNGGRPLCASSSFFMPSLFPGVSPAHSCNRMRLLGELEVRESGVVVSLAAHRPVPVASP